MQITGMLHGARLLQFVGFPAAEALVGLLTHRKWPRRDHAAGISRTVYCVNIDAVIAALLLKILWKSYRAGAASRQALEIAAFTLFLHARMIGSAAEIDDHLNRGRNMDTRTPAAQCRFVT